MSMPPSLIGTTEPFAHLLRQRDLAFLWLMRVFVALDVRLSERTPGATAFLRRLQLESNFPTDKDQLWEMHTRLTSTLSDLETHAASFHFETVLEDNLKLLEERLALTRAESKLLALASLLHSDEVMYAVASRTPDAVNVPRQLATVIGESEAHVAEALSAAGKLRSSGLVKVSGGGSLAGNLQLQRGSFRKIATQRLTSLDDLFDSCLRLCPQPASNMDDYMHVTAQAGLAASILREALDHARAGVNILIYGPPGTGKTQLARLLAAHAEAPLYEVSLVDESGEAQRSNERLQKAGTAQLLLGGRQALLLFDECDTVFNDTWSLGGESTAHLVKGWVNNLLETNPVPMLWIANRINRIDPAFVRRFDLVFKLNTLPQRQRLKLLSRECGVRIREDQLCRLAQVDKATPAVLKRTIDVASRIDCGGSDFGSTLEILLDGTLRAQGHAPVRVVNRHSPPPDYDVRLCNSSIDMHMLVQSLFRTSSGRILLYGPPGTGKTALGRWLAATLDKPLMSRRMSDLQSPWLGEMERNIADAFEHATLDEAVLQIDEIDSFLRDRREASRTWEISLVNEFLTQVESFEGILVASTNLLDSLDPAALRRFDHKIRIDFLKPEQAWRLLRHKLDQWNLPVSDPAQCQRRLAAMSNLTPGDFATVARRHEVVRYCGADEVIDFLEKELAFKEPPRASRIGFL